MDLDNSYEAIVYYILIGGMIGHSHQDEFNMVSVLVCMIKYGIRPTVNHDIGHRVLMIHQTTILHELLTLRRYWACIDVIKRLWLVGKTLKWDLKVVIYSLEIGLLLMEAGENRYSQ